MRLLRTVEPEIERRFSCPAAAEDQQESDAAEQRGLGFGDNDELQAAALEIGAPAVAEVIGFR